MTDSANTVILNRGANIAVLCEGLGPTALFAAEELRRCLAEALDAQWGDSPDGADLVVRFCPAPTGDAEYEILVDTGAGEVALRGADDAALRDAAFGFLERFAGVRWLYPGDEGEYVPQLRELRLQGGGVPGPKPLPYRGLHICGAPLHYDEQAALWLAHRRGVRKLTHHEEVDPLAPALARLGLSPDTVAHSFSFWIPDDEFFAAKPEFFSLVGGRRIRHGEGGQLCVANPELREVFVRRVREWAEAHPQVVHLGVPSNDGYGWCECENCRGLDARLSPDPANVSGRLWDFTVHVARALEGALPGRLVTQIVYSNFRTRPQGPLPGNMAVSYTAGGRCFRHSLADPNCPANAAHRAELVEWRKMCQHVYLYEYYSKGTWRDLPFPAWRTAFRDVRWMREAGLDGFFSEVGPAYRAWWAEGHKAVGAVLAALADGELDADAYMADYCRARFGPAADAMGEYFRVLEEAFMSAPGCFFASDARDLPKVLPPSAREECAALLERAAGTLERGPAFHKGQLERERALFGKWLRIERLQRETKRPGPLQAAPFPGWEAALSPREEEPSVAFTSRAYHTPPEEGGTALRLYADGGAVYFAFECFEPDMEHLKADAPADSHRVTGDDGVEIFTAVAPDAPTCRHFLATVNGCRAASDCDIAAKRWNWSWPVDWEVRVRRGADRWFLVARIPREAVGAEEGVFFTCVRNRHAGGRHEISGFPDGGAFFAPGKYHLLRLPARQP